MKENHILSDQESQDLGKHFVRVVESAVGERLRAAASEAEPVVRYCPGCGSIGAVEGKYRDCCPDGNEARMIPQPLAEKCRDTFKEAIKSMRANAAANDATPTIRNSLTVGDSVIRNSRIAGDGEAGAVPTEQEVMRLYAETLAEFSDGRGFDAGTVAFARALLRRYAAPPEKQTSHSEGDAEDERQHIGEAVTNFFADYVENGVLEFDVFDSRNIDALLDAIDAARAAPTVPHSLTVAQGDALYARMHEIAYRDTAVCVTVQAADLRAILARQQGGGDAEPTRPGVYAWTAGTSNALVLVDRRPSEHSPGGVLNGHVIHSTKFYDGCPVEKWGKDGRWVLLHDFDAARAQRAGKGEA